MFSLSFISSLLFSTIRLSTPLIFSSMGGLITRKSGSNNIALEGTMLISAMAGAVASAYSQSLIGGLIGALVSGLLISVFLGFMSLKMEADMTLTGVSINRLSDGLTIFIIFMLIGEKGTTIKLPSLSFPTVELPVIKDIPFIGDVFSGHNLLTYFAFVVVVLVWFLIYKTPLGLKIRAVGENEKAAESVGINVMGIKLLAFALTGIICSFGGAYMSMGYLSWFSASMIAGRGFIGMSAMNLSNARPFRTMFVAILFAGVDALAMTLQTLNLPPEPLQMLPYLITIIALVVVSKHDMEQEEKRKKELAQSK
ncbi:MAG: ABC transporter permease [Erysipelotrichales bacterium]|nr:ABC transporter permease [Erysipelotrichales bacterium]